MTPQNFVGVFVLWFSVAGGILVVKALATVMQRFGLAGAKITVTEPDDTASKADEVKPFPQTESEDVYHPDPSKYPAGLDINNVSAMLRYLIVKMHDAETSKAGNGARNE